MLKVDKLQLSKYEEKSGEIFVEKSVAKVFFDRFGTPCWTISICICTLLILSLREIRFEYHNDTMSLGDTHLCPLQYAALPRDCQNCANISIDVSEVCS